MLIWVRPGKGLYKARKPRSLEEPCDVTWDEDPNVRHWPNEPSRWPEAGVMAENLDPEHDCPRAQDPTDNPWGHFIKEMEDGRSQVRDAKTANAKYTREVIHMNFDHPDWAMEIVEISEREYEKGIQQKGEMSVCQSHPGKVQGIVSLVLLSCFV